MSKGKGNPSILPLNSELAARIRDGETVEQIAAQYGVTASRVRHRLFAAGWGSDGVPVTKVPEKVDLTTTLRNPAWMDDGLCRQVNPEWFFPETGVNANQAKSVCLGTKDKPGCPVRAKCLQYALERNEHYGVWGGVSERDRRRMRRRMLGLEPAPSKSGLDYGLVREWARRQDMEVGDVGVLPRKVVEAYREAHPQEEKSA